MKATTSNPVAAVRAATGLSREKFAKAIGGVTQAALQHYEIGRSKLSENVAGRIEARFGVRAASLLTGGKPTMICGRPVTREMIQKWQAASPKSREDFERDAGELSRRIRVLLEAVGPEEYLNTLLSLEHAVDYCAREISAEAIAAVERQKGEVAVKEMTVAELEKDLGISPIWKAFVAEQQPKPRERAQVVVETFQRWARPEERSRLIAAFIEQGGCNHIAYSVHLTRRLYRITFKEGSRTDVPVDSFNVSGIGPL